jgi:competence protein ComEC
MHSREYIALSILLGLALVLRIFFAYTHAFAYGHDDIKKRVSHNEVRIFYVRAIEPLDVRERVSYITVCDISQHYVSGEFACDNEAYIRLTLSQPCLEDPQVGDVLKIQGALRTPQSFSRGDAGNFDYKNFLYQQGIEYEITSRSCDVIHVQKDMFDVSVSRLNQWRHVLGDMVMKGLPKEQASLAAGILLGEKRLLGKTLLDDFRHAGVIHIVVLSGFNVAIVALVVLRIASLTPLPGLFRWGVATLFLCAFGIMVGGGSTVIRSVAMVGITGLAQAFHRACSPRRALFVAAYCMVFHNPLIVVYDPSFQLSFMATLSVIEGTPFIEKWFAKMKWLPAVFVEILSTTIASQIGVTPLIMFMMGEVSLIGLLSNILIVPIVPLVMLLITLKVVVLWNDTLCTFVTMVSDMTLQYILRIVEYTAHMPYAIVRVGMSLSTMLFVYGFYGVIALIYYLRLRREKNFQL